MPLNIIFMGTPEFGVPILKSIYNSKHKILQVYTQSQKKKDRGQKIGISPIHLFSKSVNLPVRHPEILEENEFKNFKNLSPDVVVVAAYGKIIPKSFLNLKKIKFINIHASLLPKWRGAAPIQRSIMNLDTETGISIMKIEPKLDTGPIMMSSKIKMSKDINFADLSFKLSVLGAELTIKSLNLIEKKKETFIPQNESVATYAKKIRKIEAKIDWRQKAKIVVAKINALNVNPGCWFFLNGLRIKVLKAIEVKAIGKPGEIINENFTIACSENAVQILELKREGKQKMKTHEFLKGNNLKVGINILSNV